LHQARIVIDLIGEAHPELELQIHEYEASGDRMLDIPAPQLAADAFTDSIEEALRDGSIDVAVHSYKDLPVDSTSDLVIAAIPVRADPREALVCARRLTLRELPAGSVVGTSSERRGSAVLALRPDLRVKPIRGAVDARVAKVFAGEYDAALLALAGLQRLGLEEHITEIFGIDVMPPAAGQGALAVQCRADDAFVRAILADIDHVGIRQEVEGEIRAAKMATAI
jgi:hydroxymethylbilane synthase